LPDGSYLSRIYQSAADRRRQNNGIVMRVIDYALDGVADAEPIYRLVTTILDHQQAPATELAALYHERWEIETAFDELKTHLRGAKIILRSKTPDLVRQSRCAGPPADCEMALVSPDGPVYLSSLSGGSGFLVSLRKKFASSWAVIVSKRRGLRSNLKKPSKSPVARASANPSEPFLRSKTPWMNLRMLPKSCGRSLLM
jgi:hypothetical protein